MPNLSMPKTKILVLYYFFYPNLSGVGEVIYSYCSKYLEMYPNCEIHLLCQNNPLSGSYQAEYDDVNGIKITRYKSSALLGGRVPLPSQDFITKLSDELDQFKPDQVHLHTRFATATLFGLLLCKFKGQKNLFHWEHLSNYILGEKKSTEAICWVWDNTISRLMFVLSDKIVCVSDSVQKFITTNLGANPKKCIVIENGCNFVPNPLSLVEKFQDKKFFNLFFAARFVPLKNPLILLESIKIMNQTRSDFHLKIAGTGKLEGEMMEYVKANNLENTITFLGKLDRGGMSQQFQVSDIFLNPSRLEGFPGGVLEAVFNDNLCLVTDVGGNNDIVKVPELLIKIEDLNPQNLANKISYILDNPLQIAQKAQNDKDRVTQKNTWENVIKQLVKI